MIVIIVLTIGLDAGGAGRSVDGISAATAAPDRAQVRATAIRNRLMHYPPCSIDARLLVSKIRFRRIGGFLHATAPETNIPAEAKFLHSPRKVLSS